jgi:dipeptidyl aminopeptidase/acylaminoacyl peptidase
VGKVSLSDLCSDGKVLYWLESRPTDGGRVVFVRSDGDGVVDLSPEGVSIRSRVHEYGGGAVCLLPGHGGSAFAYVAHADQRVWSVSGPGAQPIALTAQPPEGETWNHGGLEASADGDWVLAVREIHPGHGPDRDRPRRCVVALGTRSENSGDSVLLEGHDFYGAPRLNLSGNRVATVVWDHPDMPWDYSAVQVVALTRRSDAATGHLRLAAEGAPWTISQFEDDSKGQPMWSRHGGLSFVSDRAGWWHPYRHSGADDMAAPTPTTDVAAEFHGADFILGLSTMVERDDGTLVARMSTEGRDALVVLLGRGSIPLSPPLTIPQPCVTISTLIAHGDGLAFIGATPQSPADVWLMPSLPEPARPVGPKRPRALAQSDVSVGGSFTLSGRSGRPVHGVLFPPTLQDTDGPPQEVPPLIVHCHGGPTSAASAAFDVTVQYFTSRGFAVACVDYAGSTGYGRAYRCALWGLWGEADSEDCVDAARHLADLGQVDGRRMAIRGSSSGGLTALNALTAPDGFTAATSWYGVTDLMGLAASTHDFEAHYMDRLIGPLPEFRETYEARSPVTCARELHGSVLLLQGGDDPIVPPAQAEELRDALLGQGRRCEAHFFPGEGHGFRQAETLRFCLQVELDFYLRELGL